MDPFQGNVVDLDILASGNMDPTAAVLASHRRQRSHLVRKQNARGEPYAQHESAILSLFVHALRDAERSVLRRRDITRLESFSLLSKFIQIGLEGRGYFEDRVHCFHLSLR